MATEYTWNGTGLKYAVSMTCEGFDMNEDDWTITVSRGSKSLKFTKSNAVQDENEQWYICFDSSYFGAGLMNIVFDASVPDEDFEGGIRHEVQKYELINVQKV